MKAGKMAQWVKVSFTTKPDDLNLIPRTHMVKRENKFL